MGRRRTVNTHLPRRMVQRRGAYYHVVTCGLTATGKPRKVWTPLGRDFGVALRKWAEIEGQRPAQSVTVATMLADYIAHCQSRSNRASPETVRGYLQSAKRLGAVFGHMHPPDLRREHVYRYVVEGSNVAANRDRALLGAAWTHASNLGNVSGPNPAHGLRYRNPERPRRRYVTDAELERLVAASPNHRVGGSSPSRGASEDAAYSRSAKVASVILSGECHPIGCVRCGRRARGA